MDTFRRNRLIALSVAATLVCASVLFAQTQTTKPFEPQVGQQGKDVVWVPTPQALVDKMLDIAKVTAQDYVMDLGSGDGRTSLPPSAGDGRGHRNNPTWWTCRSAMRHAGVTAGDVREHL
jgi:hypothetical protein